MFKLKFHCELNPIECIWCHTKIYTHTHCNYTYWTQELERITIVIIIGKNYNTLVTNIHTNV